MYCVRLSNRGEFRCCHCRGTCGLYKASARSEGDTDASLTVENELASSTKRIGDLDEGGASFVGEGLSGRPAASGEEEVVLGTSLADGVDDALDRGDPGRHGLKVMRLVHDAENDTLVGAVLLRELRPETLELSVGGAALGDDGTVPAGVVVLSSVCRCQHTPVYNR